MPFAFILFLFFPLLFFPRGLLAHRPSCSQVNLPTIPILYSPLDAGADSSRLDGPGAFDIRYLDADLLIIQQRQPGGLYVLTKRPDLEDKLV